MTAPLFEKTQPLATLEHMDSTEALMAQTHAMVEQLRTLLQATDIALQQHERNNLPPPPPQPAATAPMATPSPAAGQQLHATNPIQPSPGALK